MADIANLDTYIASLSTTLYDKCWWIDKLPPEVNTVIDFGCASGDLALMIHRISPGKFRYIGIENSPDMLIRAANNQAISESGVCAKFFPRIEDALSEVDPSRAVLVLNSVLHEIYHYLTESDASHVLSVLFGSGFRTIAIRDMHAPSSLTCSFCGDDFQRVEESRYADRWHEFLKICIARKPICKLDSEWLHEFFLKYRYDANWDRESVERYLWNWTRMLEQEKYIGDGFHTNYRIVLKQDFYIPFLSERVWDDFRIMWVTSTHRKMLLYSNKGGTA